MDPLLITPERSLSAAITARLDLARVANSLPAPRSYPAERARHFPAVGARASSAAGVSKCCGVPVICLA